MPKQYGIFWKLECSLSFSQRIDLSVFFSFSRVHTGSDEMADYVKGNWGKAMLELRLANSVFTLAVAALLFFGLVQV